MNRKNSVFCGSVARALFAFVLMCATGAGAQTLKVLHNFGGPGSEPQVLDARTPQAGLTFDGRGNLYGTSNAGGYYLNNCTGAYNGCGTVFELTPKPDGSWSESLLYLFRGGEEGGLPTAPVVLDRLRNVYLTSNCSYDCAADNGGGVFRLRPNADGTWVASILYDLSLTGCIDDPTPHCAVTLDSTGALYVVTRGTIFSLNPKPVYRYRLDIYKFSDTDANPLLTFDANGNIYDTTSAGGTTGSGTVAKLTPPGWTETVLYSFRGGTDGENPRSGVAFDAVGNLYGTTYQGGTAGAGTVFKLTPNLDGTWTKSALYSFQGGSDASAPYGPVRLDTAGNLYGTASGGAYGHGAVFKLAPSAGGQWTETILYSFTGGLDGDDPSGGVILDQMGNLYGTTQSGGAFSGGVAFEIIP